MQVIDLHTHGMSGYDTRSTDIEHLLRITELHGQLGTTQLVFSIYPAPVPVMRASLALIRDAMAMQTAQAATSAPRPMARIIGAHLEGPFLNPSKAGALNSMAFLLPNEKIFRQLIDGFEDLILIMTIAPELDRALALIRLATDYGIRVNMGHSNASYAEAAAGFRAGAKGITHLFNAMSGFHHREPGLAGFGLMHDEIYVEIIGDPFHLHHEVLRMIFTLKNPERILLISDSVKDTHASSAQAAVTAANGTLLGGGMALMEAARFLEQLGIHWDTIVKSISDNPERYLSL